MRVLMIVLDYLSYLPPAFLCFLPMKDQLRFSVRRIAATSGTAMLATMLVLGWAQYRFELEANTVLLPMLAVCFFAFQHCQRATLWQSLSVFCASLALMTILSNIATCAGALLFTKSENFMLHAILLQVGLNTAFSALLAIPYARYGSYIVNEMRQKHVWQMTLLFSVCVFAANMLLLPIVNAVIGNATQLVYMLLVLAAILFLFLLMHVIFYFTVSEIMAQKKAEARTRFWESQQSQFAAQQRYMKETEKAHHDFRQSIRTLTELYDAGDHEAVGRYLHQFADAMPVSEIRFFCNDTALNALLNYYDHLTRQEQIGFTVQVRLPDTLPVSDVDLCGMIGNILENAVTACRKAEEKRIQLTVLTEEAAQLYIVAVNTFNGVVKQADGRYLSTNRKGSGVGLSSVISTAEAYGGVARFSHKGTEFYSNVAIPLT